jgi:hypothetical protein
MVPVLTGLPAFLFTMLGITVTWIWYNQRQIIQVKASIA